MSIYSKYLNEDISTSNIQAKDLNGKQLFTLFVYLDAEKANQYLIDNNIETMEGFSNIPSADPEWIAMFTVLKKYSDKVTHNLLWKIYVGDIKIQEVRN